MTQMRTIESVPFAKELAAALATPGTDAMRVAEDFFGLADLFKENTRLARAATDPARSVADKRGLASSAFASHVTAATLSVVNAVVADHWRHPADVADTLEVLGILGVLNAAGAHNALDQVREELFQVRYFLAHNREVRVRLSDTSKGNSHERGDIATKLFGERISVWTMRLVRRAVGRSNHGRLLHNLRRYAQWAATMQDRLFVTVATASPMSDAQVERLRTILTKRYGTPVDLAISVDPELIGGFRLRAGMTAIDASLASRISAARDAIAS